MNRNRTHDRGSALVVTLILALLCAGLAMTMMKTSGTQTRTSRFSVDWSRILRIAEGGLDEAIQELRSGVDIDDDGIGYVEGTLDGGTYVVEIFPSWGEATEYVLTSVATVQGRSRAVEATVHTASQSGASYGFFGADSVVVSGGARLDSYDSRKGSYESQAVNSDPLWNNWFFAGSNGHVASNGNIRVDFGGAVIGDATPGPGGSVSVQEGWSTVTGSTAASTQSFELEVDPYAPPTTATTAFAMTRDTATLASGTHHFSSFSLDRRAKLLIDGHVKMYVDADFEIGGQASIELMPGATLEIEVGEGSFHVGGRGIVNETQLPKDLHVVHHGAGNVYLDGQSNFYGLVEAPHARIEATDKAEYFGALLGRELYLKGYVYFHRDESAISVSSDETAFRVGSWREFAALPGKDG